MIHPILLRIILAGCLVLAIPHEQLRAQLNVKVSGGLSTYQGDWGSSFLDPDQPFHGLVGLRLGYALTERYNISLGTTFGRHGFENTDGGFLSDLVHTSLLFHVKALQTKRYNLSIHAGASIANHLPVDGRASLSQDWAIPFGFAFEARITKTIGLFYQNLWGYNFGDSYDNNALNKGNDLFLNHELGFSFTFNFAKEYPEEVDVVFENEEEDMDEVEIMDSTIIQVEREKVKPEITAIEKEILPAFMSPPTVQESLFYDASKKIEFNWEGNDLTDEAKAHLTDFINNPRLDLANGMSIHSYCDGTADKAFAQQLSWDRAMNIKEFFVTNGADPSLITIVAHGMGACIASNKTEEGLQINNRIRLYSND